MPCYLHIPNINKDICVHINILSARKAKKRNKTNKKVSKASADGKQDWCGHTRLSREKKRREKKRDREGREGWRKNIHSFSREREC